MKIPIQNIYYLLCYAWNKLDEGQRINVSPSDYADSIELFSRVLINGCKHLFKQGLESNYSEIIKEIPSIKGKIVFKESLNANSFRKGRAFCQFDKYDPNTLSNQILKSTLRQIVKIKSIDKKLKDELWKYYWRFQYVDDIELSLHHFNSVSIHRNNVNYDFLIKICRIVFENIVIDEVLGEYHFKEFIGNDKEMAALFESFVRNFYSIEQVEYRVRREDISWNAVPIGGTNESYLPKMQTDVTLESAKRKIIIETKFYYNALNTRFETQKFNSGNLYQIYSYLRNIELKQDQQLNKDCEGILLYPSVNYKLDETFLMGSHKISIKTINLSQDWKVIHRDLLELLNISSSE